jgi:hypothetical protein
MSFEKALTICKGKAKEYTEGNVTTLVMFVIAPSLVYAQLATLLLGLNKNVDVHSVFDKRFHAPSML